MDRNRTVYIWKMPFLMAVLTVVGLVSALLGTGLWHWLSWAAMCIPAIILVRYIFSGYWRNFLP